MALGVDQGLDRPARQDGDHDLREERCLEMWLRVERILEPALELSDALVGDRVPATVGALGPLDRRDSDPAALLEPAKCRVDLGEGDRPVRGEVPVEQPLQVVAVARLLLEQAEECMGDAHGRNYKLR